MTYVPSGFWPRLISRFLTCTTFVSIVLRALGNSEEEISDKVSRVMNGESSKALGLEWAYWKTGIELWYKGMSLLRVTEIESEGIFNNCNPSPSIFERSSTVPIRPSLDIQNLSFELNGQWMPVDMTPNHGIEILVPDTVCPAILKNELESYQETWGAESEELIRESVWMSAGLLTQAVDFIDTLLEDWYPGLGAREGNTTMESIPYVNRVIPCPFCVSGASYSDPQYRSGSESTSPSPSVDHQDNSPSAKGSPKDKSSTPNSTPSGSPKFSSPQPTRQGSQEPWDSDHDSDHSVGRPHRSRAKHISPSIVQSTKSAAAKRKLFKTSSPPPSAPPTSVPSEVSALLSPHQERRVLSLQRGRSLSSPLTNSTVASGRNSPLASHVTRNKSQDSVMERPGIEISSPGQ